MTNMIMAIFVGIVSLGIFRHFLFQKDGVARILLLLFFGSIGVWALFRGIILYLITGDIISARLGMDIVGELNYAIYLPVVASAVYLIYERKK